MRFISSIFSIYYFLQNSKALNGCYNSFCNNENSAISNINSNFDSIMKMPLPITNFREKIRNTVINNLSFSVVTGTVTAPTATTPIVFTETPTVASNLVTTATFKPMSSCFGKERMLYFEFQATAAFTATEIKALKIISNLNTGNSNNNLNSEQSIDNCLKSDIYSVFVKVKNSSNFNLETPTNYPFALSYSPEENAYYIIFTDAGAATFEPDANFMNNLILIVAYNTYATTSLVTNTVINTNSIQVNLNAPFILPSSEANQPALPESFVNTTPSPSFINYCYLADESVQQLGKIYKESQITNSEPILSEAEFKKFKNTILLEKLEKIISDNIINVISKDEKVECDTNKVFLKYFAFVSRSLTCFNNINTTSYNSFVNYMSTCIKETYTSFDSFTAYMTCYCNIQSYDWKIQNKDILCMFDSYCAFNMYCSTDFTYLCDLYDIPLNKYAISSTTDVKVDIKYNEDLDSELEKDEDSKESSIKKTTEPLKDKKTGEKKNFISRNKVAAGVIISVTVVVVAIVGYSFM